MTPDALGGNEREGLRMSGYPIILNGGHAEFELEWAGKDPKTHPDWPLPSFDARDWAEHFCKQYPAVPEDIMIGWFANALMRGYEVRQRPDARLR